LFGIEKGVAKRVERRICRFETANHCSLFLNEIGDLNLAAQAKLLRALQERAVDRVDPTRPILVDIPILEKLRPPTAIPLAPSAINSFAKICTIG
jgi:transcriptional regulator with GAF, ATPase, and Fis domain